MTINNKVRDEQLQYNINQEGANVLVLPFGNIDENKYLSGEEILLQNQRRLTEQVKFTYSPLGKAFEKKQRKTWRHENLVKLDNEFKSKRKEGLAKKQNAFDSVNALYEGVELIFNVQMWNISEIRQIIHSLS